MFGIRDSWRRSAPLAPRSLENEYGDDYDREDQCESALHLPPSTLDIRHSSLPSAP